ncbi:PEP-CTERM sorting domain-containing protein [Adhaeretor mobilis]|uniref:PEP-CTERM motif protein n=1 Tax=Adhaeretor mobilis TaxID=1930276 RepID=A0A517MU63_9BACT|nr:PEP-CTERM sorting domain-containing protein [Adhaeretor mobilis]QDS98424.1 PEP-CTERM motif protein [Adhaeretor mobilis]
MKKMFKQKFLSAMLTSGILIVASHATAAVIAWGPVTAVTGDEAAEVSTAGVFEQGYNLSGDGDTSVVVINGDAYVNRDDFLPSNAGTFDAYPANNATTTSYEDLLSDVDFRGGRDNIGDVITLTDLNPGDEYLLQLWYSDDPAQTREIRVAGDEGLSTTPSLTNPSYVIGTFVADPGGAQDLNLLANDRGARLNGIQLRNTTIPEPSTLALLGLAFAGLAGSRRRSA